MDEHTDTATLTIDNITSVAHREVKMQHGLVMECTRLSVNTARRSDPVSLNGTVTIWY